MDAVRAPGARGLPQPPLAAQVAAPWAARCASLGAAGLVAGENVKAQSASALAKLHASGWTDDALRAGALSAGFDLWRAVAATYASAYGRFDLGSHPADSITPRWRPTSACGRRPGRNVLHGGAMAAAFRRVAA